MRKPVSTIHSRSIVTRSMGMLLMICLLYPAIAQRKGQPRKKWWNLDSLAAMNLRFIPLPSLSASPETGLRAGLTLDYFYKTTSDDDSSVRTSFSWLAASYSTRKQFNLEGFTATFTRNENFYIGFRGGYVNNYERYWGQGFQRNNDAYHEVTYQRLFAAGRVSRKLAPRIFAGLEYYFSNHYGIKKDSSNYPVGHASNGFNTTSIGGLGWNLIIDKRDNQFSPSQGMYVDLANSYFFDLLNGNGFEYANLVVDFRKYFEVKRHVFATQLYLQHMEGNVPTLELQRLGGSNMMRGFFQGRLRDKTQLVAQAEYRYSLGPLFKLAFFGSADRMAPGFDAMREANWLATGGTGLRWLFNKKKKVYLRADVAYSSFGTLGYYFKIGDAF